jgi:hypothetical protein
MTKLSREFKEFIETTFSPPRGYENKRRLEELEIQRRERDLASADASPPGTPRVMESLEPGLRVWKGNLRDLAAWIIDLYEKQHLIEADTPRQAVLTYAPMFAIRPKDGGKPAPVDGLNCYNSYQSGLREGKK